MARSVGWLHAIPLDMTSVSPPVSVAMAQGGVVWFITIRSGLGPDCIVLFRFTDGTGPSWCLDANGRPSSFIVTIVPLMTV
jgi:hypothetical protein